MGDERGPGRPEVGPATNVRLGEELTAQLDAARRPGESRAAAIRRLLDIALQAESATERVRRMAQVWVDIRPTHPTATREGHTMAYAGQQILAALDHPTDTQARPQ